MGRQWSNHGDERPHPEGVKLKGEAMPTYVRSVSGDTRVNEPSGGFDPLDDQDRYGAAYRRARDQFDVNNVTITRLVTSLY